jgi:hypothetical protein
LAATILMNGRAPTFFQRSPPVAAVTPPTPPEAAEPSVPAAVKQKPPVNDRFQPIEIGRRGEINKATLARCRSHVEAGRAFESLSLKRIAELRDARKMGDTDPEAICRDHLTAEARQSSGR